MDDTISRQVVLDIVDSYSESQSNVEDVTQDIISDIMGLPPVTPQPKMGRWIWQTEDIYRCSECGNDIRVKEVMNVPQYVCCPLCGAKMREVEE